MNRRKYGNEKDKDDERKRKGNGDLMKRMEGKERKEEGRKRVKKVDEGVNK